MGIVLRESRFGRNGHRVLSVQASYALVPTGGEQIWSLELSGISGVGRSRFFTLTGSLDLSIPTSGHCN
jgi:hypothetical protein